MSQKQLEAQAARSRPRGRAKGVPVEESGQPTRGRIRQLLRGQGHGFIRAEDGRMLFFHQSAVTDRAFYDLEVGDVVQCEAIADRLTGPRAIKVRKV